MSRHRNGRSENAPVGRLTARSALAFAKQIGTHVSFETFYPGRNQEEKRRKK